MSTTEDLNWFKSSYSGDEGDNCVEVAVQPAAVHVRDSKDSGLRPFTVSPAAWTAFTATQLSWHRSSYSGDGGDNCVEVAMQPTAVHVRDSKDSGLRPFTTSPAAWAAFTTYAADGDI